MVRRVRRRLHEVDHGIHRHALRRIKHELAPLDDVASHLHQVVQGLRLQRRHQAGNALLQRRCFLAALGLEFLRNLQEVAHHHLIVRGVALVIVDGLGHDDRIGGVCRLEIRVLVEVSRQRGAGETNPQLGGPAAAPAHLGLVVFRRLFLEQLQLLEGQRIKAGVRPLCQHVIVFEAQRPWTPPSLHRQGGQHVANFRGRHTLAELHRAQMVPVQAQREIPQHGIGFLGGHALDDQLVTRHAER